MVRPLFEDSTMESAGRIHTRRKWTAIGSLILQAAILAALLLLPEIYPAALPKQAMQRLLIAPAPPPSAPEVVQNHPQLRTSEPLLESIDAFAAPRRIPQHPSLAFYDPGAPSVASSALDSGSGTGLPGGISDLLNHGMPAAVVHPVATAGPVRLSSGVAAGQLLSPIHATYPAIAKATRTQGTVVVEATISRAGTIENLRVVSGPPMLQSAATEVIRAARYRPFLLNGEPVEVQTTINVIFSLGG